MLLTRLEISGFKSFAKKTVFDFGTSVVAIVGPNGSGKSNVAESIRFVLGEQSMKSMRGKRGEDMIWNGSNTVPRMNRGSVAIVFDNRSKFLNVDFDEVSVERVVNRDGTNEYRLNGSAVRLKDILELLAGANIGQTGHHIISQGEADKILSASPRERREMLEDALGLKAYQYKIEESERKLQKTEENMRQVTALRREIAPHLRFLKKQVEKLEKARELKDAAVARFQMYFGNEEVFVTTETSRIEKELSAAKEKLSGIHAKVADAKETLKGAAEDTRGNKILSLSEELNKARQDRSDAARAAARLDGQIEIVEKSASRATVSASDISRLAEESEAGLSQLGSGSLDAALAFLKELLSRLKALVRTAESGAGDLEALRRERDTLQEEEKAAAKREGELSASLEAIRKELEDVRLKERQKERALFELTAEEREVKHMISLLTGERERLSLIEEEWKRDMTEAATLVGRAVLSYTKPAVPTPREAQEKEKRELEKIKIRLEEMGASGGEEMMKEYQEATEREAFLERELADLESASAQLKTLIEDLKKELSVRFKRGIDAINGKFTKLFALMFDGGSASLVRTEEPVKKPSLAAESDEEGEEETAPKGEKQEFVEGLDISLSIPRKRVKSLVMLSGGERALTSIALIFAMSSVNPPPFLVLDETDAALDESNSRRYGDMVEALSKKSQLILITHNRETMSRAGVLYGVTMGNDGVSKVLSVKLEEAVQVAK